MNLWPAFAGQASVRWERSFVGRDRVAMTCTKLLASWATPAFTAITKGYSLPFIGRIMNTPSGVPPSLVVRTQRDPRSLAQAIRKELKAAEPDVHTRYRVARQGLYDSTQAQRTYMLYLAVFAGVGLLLSALGIYGVLAFSVAQRTREIGIRMAVGAERRHVLGMVMKEGASLAGVGVIAGVVAALWLTRLLQSQLFEVSPVDPGVFAGVSLLLLAIALLACLLPARRATRINPLEALRYE